MISQAVTDTDTCFGTGTSADEIPKARPALKVLLVGNHPFAGVYSMQIFAETLRQELARLGADVHLIVPHPFLGRFQPSGVGLGKWLAYVDRFLIFPRHLRAAAASAHVVHICDHSDAMYSAMITDRPVLVTCHDMLAVRRALGEVHDVKPSLLGHLLQRWVCRGLRQATHVACVSRYTLGDAARILEQKEKLSLVWNGLHFPFAPLPESEVRQRMASVPDIQKRFVLHVGSSHARKNREGVLRIFAQTAAQLDLQLVFAGAPLQDEQIALAQQLQVWDRVIQVAGPSDELLEALYNRAFAFLFPSQFEGFGWPPIEAQACGCPVIASDIPALAEVLGNSAVLRPLQDEAGMAAALVRMAADPSFRDSLRQEGLAHAAEHFTTSRMIAGYVSLYRALTGPTA